MSTLRHIGFLVCFTNAAAMLYHDIFGIKMSPTSRCPQRQAVCINSVMSRCPASSQNIS